jgi:hypothetical protein
MTDLEMADCLNHKTERRFAEAIEWVRDAHCVNLIINVGLVYRLKSIPCLLGNSHASEPPELFSMGPNKNFTIQDYCELFSELMAVVSSFGIVLFPFAMEICLPERLDLTAPGNWRIHLRFMRNALPISQIAF